MSGWNLVWPWEPSPTVVAVTLMVAGLYWRGRRRWRVAWPRQLAFWSGLALLYAALHTGFDYYAEHEFFVHRLQHLALHHLGPFLLALAWPMPTWRAGLPVAWRRALGALAARAPVRAALRFVTDPVVTGGLFVGLIWFWLIPSVHFYAMLDVRLYRLMNWSMAVDGVIFWLLVLDRRPSPPARLPPAVRVLLLALVIPPQIMAGALITFSGRRLYPLYELCGRAFAGIGAGTDQKLGGLILWIPGVMMCMAGGLVALALWFRLSERREGGRPTGARPWRPRAISVGALRREPVVRE